MVSVPGVLSASWSLAHVSAAGVAEADDEEEDDDESSDPQAARASAARIAREASGREVTRRSLCGPCHQVRQGVDRRGPGRVPAVRPDLEVQMRPVGVASGTDAAQALPGGDHVALVD